MKRTTWIAAVTVVVFAPSATAADTKITALARAATSGGNQYYTGNRPPLAASPLVKLPVGAVQPEGWIREQLAREADGFIGHLDELSRFLKKEGNAWLSPQGEGHSPWEELPYWLKGFIDLGYVLDDPRIIRESNVWIEATLASQREDGWFGPRANLHGRTGDDKPDLWPNMLMLNALQSYYEHTQDKRVLELMTRYFQWELALPDDQFLPPFWQQQRAGDNMASVYWLYNRTGDEFLLKLADKIQRNMADWTTGVPNWHGVNVCQCFRSPAVYWMQSGNPQHLAAAERNYQTVMGLYGQVPGGMFGADENCREGYGGPRQAAESCSMAELMLSDEMLTTISGNALWADRCEEVAFNSFPACMTPDLKALRYLTAPNMVLSDQKSKSPGLQNSGPMLLMNPHGHRCCQHNIGHAWPRFAQHLWMAAAGDGLAAVLYGPCKVTAKVGDGTEVTLTEQTKYPFDETVAITVATPRPVAFPIVLRVPGWCAAPKVAVNGVSHEMAAVKAPGWLQIDRTWSDGDRVELTLPMKIALTTWKKNQDSVSVSRGPLTWSLKIGEKVVRVGGTDRWPAVEIRPTTAWNYGLVLDADDPAAGFEAIQRDWDGTGQPWTIDAAPIELKTRAKQIPEWKMDYLGLVGPLCPSPAKSTEPTETVTLVPMGCARLRITAFPTIGAGADAHQWVEPVTTVPHKSSHCFAGDSENALSDGRVPRNSNDHAIPRFTWWPHRGTSEWVTYEFKKPRELSQVEVYWFDDTGVGQCRVPKGWKLEYRDGDTWKPVRTKDDYGTAPDQFNRLTFERVTSDQLRIVVELQPQYSSGILEWRVK